MVNFTPANLIYSRRPMNQQNNPPESQPPPKPYQPSDVTDLIIAAIENDLGMGSGAWDTVSPREIIAATCNHRPVGATSEELAAVKAERDRMREALSNVMQYLHDTDELGEEYLTPKAKECYEKARAAISQPAADESEKAGGA